MGIDDEREKDAREKAIDDWLPIMSLFAFFYID